MLGSVGEGAVAVELWAFVEVLVALTKDVEPDVPEERPMQTAYPGSRYWQLEPTAGFQLKEISMQQLPAVALLMRWKMVSKKRGCLITCRIERE